MDLPSFRRRWQPNTSGSKCPMSIVPSWLLRRLLCLFIEHFFVYATRQCIFWPYAVDKDIYSLLTQPAKVQRTMVRASRAHNLMCSSEAQREAYQKYVLLLLATVLQFCYDYRLADSFGHLLNTYLVRNRPRSDLGIYLCLYLLTLALFWCSRLVYCTQSLS